MGDGCLLLIGQLYARAHVCSQVCFAANQQDACAGTEVLDLCFPLQGEQKIIQQTGPLSAAKLLCHIKTGDNTITFFSALSTVSGRLMSKHRSTASESL